MKIYKVAHTDLVVSRIAYGCAHLAGWNRTPISAADIHKAERVIHAAIDSGITLFDHADLYAFGKSEETFGEVLRRSPTLRERMVIQSKCGQRLPDGWRPNDPIHIDLSSDHIVTSVEGSLRRLRTDRLDILLLHAADTLMEPEEIAHAFDELAQSGKVRYFGVSNYNSAQIQLLKKSVQQSLIINQVQLSLSHTHLLVDGAEFALQVNKGIAGDRGYFGLAGAGTLDYCRIHDIQIQAYAPLRGVLASSAGSRPETKQVPKLLQELAAEKETTPSAIALAWILAHPARIVPIIGSCNPAHIRENCSADQVVLQRNEWHRLFSAATDLQALCV